MSKAKVWKKVSLHAARRWRERARLCYDGELPRIEEALAGVMQLSRKEAMRLNLNGSKKKSDVYYAVPGKRLVFVISKDGLVITVFVTPEPAISIPETLRAD